jgi:hypothetical protein
MSTTKEERVARLAVAREKRLRDNPPAYKEYCQWVVNLPEDDTYSFKNVREWIKEARAHRTAAHMAYKMGGDKSRANYEMWNAYVTQLEGYLRTGGYTSMFSGGSMQSKVKSVCIAMAYYPNGKPKRQMGVYYKDYMQEWTPKLENEERRAFGMEELTINESGAVLVERSSAPSNYKKGKAKKKPMGILQKQAFVERMAKARAAKQSN